jgi:hypothetical protein
VSRIRDSVGRHGLESSMNRLLAEEVDEGAIEYSLEELAEFLEADLADVPADLEFKRTLREKLWEMVQARNRLRGRGPDRR